MIRSEFVVTKRHANKARTRDVILRSNGRKVGVIFEPYGVKAGYKFQIMGRDYASALRYSTIKKAVIAMGDALWASKVHIL